MFDDDIIKNYTILILLICLCRQYVLIKYRNVLYEGVEK